MTRKQAGIVREKRPTRATRRGSLDRYCKTMKRHPKGLQDHYGRVYLRFGRTLVRERSPQDFIET